MFALTIQENDEKLIMAAAMDAGLGSRLNNLQKGSLSAVASNRSTHIISGLDFSGQKLEGSYGSLNFAECDFSGCDFSQAEITGVLQVTNCRLEGAKFPAEQAASLMLSQSNYRSVDGEEGSGVGFVVTFTHPNFEEFTQKAGISDD